MYAYPKKNGMNPIHGFPHYLLVIPREQWEDILKRNQWNEVDIRDSRYHHIIHMVSAANGAELFYTIEVQIGNSKGLLQCLYVHSGETSNIIIGIYVYFHFVAGPCISK